MVGVRPRRSEAALGSVQVSYLEVGDADCPTVFLLHGWPQTAHAWRKLFPLLSGLRVVAPDLRGLGETRFTQDRSGGFDKRAVARDVLELSEHLDVESFAVVGHDVGGLVAWALANLAPTRVCALAVLDVTIPVGDVDGLSQGGARWHHGFHRTEGLPEALVAGREDIYLDWFFDHLAGDPSAIEEAARREFLRSYARPEVFAAGLEYYRAFPRDARDNEADARGGRLSVPTLALGGVEGWGRGTEPLASLEPLVERVVGGALDDCGHFIPEEAPERLASLLNDFLPDVCQSQPVTGRG